MTFTVRLERADGTPAEPPTIKSTVTNWRTGDTIPLGRERTLRTRLKNDESHPLRWLSAFRDIYYPNAPDGSNTWFAVVVFPGDASPRAAAVAAGCPGAKTLGYVALNESGEVIEVRGIPEG